VARTGREEPATRADLAALTTKADLAAFELRFTNRLYALAIGIAVVTVAAAKLIP
jgi:hypothetical protein